MCKESAVCVQPSQGPYEQGQTSLQWVLLCLTHNVKTQDTTAALSSSSPLTLCSHPIKLLYNLPSGTQFRSWIAVAIPKCSENKISFLSFCIWSEFSQLPPWTQQSKKLRNDHLQPRGESSESKLEGMGQGYKLPEPCSGVSFLSQGCIPKGSISFPKQRHQVVTKCSCPKPMGDIFYSNHHLKKSRCLKN